MLAFDARRAVEWIIEAMKQTILINKNNPRATVSVAEVCAVNHSDDPQTKFFQGEEFDGVVKRFTDGGWEPMVSHNVTKTK